MGEARIACRLEGATCSSLGKWKRKHLRPPALCAKAMAHSAALSPSPFPGPLCGLPLSPGLHPSDMLLQLIHTPCGSTHGCQGLQELQLIWANGCLVCNYVTNKSSLGHYSRPFTSICFVLEPEEQPSPLLCLLYATLTCRLCRRVFWWSRLFRWTGAFWRQLQRCRKNSPIMSKGLGS